MQEIWQKLKEANSIVLATHTNPDGDTISSALAMYIVLKRMGKKVSLYNKEKDLPIKFDFLPNFSKFKTILPPKYDLLVALDSGDFKRLGLEVCDAPIINIDHHKSNQNFGTYNIVHPNRPSASLVVYDFLVANDELISRDVATCIYTGLASDSGFFQHRGVDEEVFSIASTLVQKGANPALVAKNLNQRNSLAKLRLTELFLRSIELKNQAKIAIGTVTKEDFLKSGADKSDSDELVNILISLSTVKFAIFLREVEKNLYKFSLRSKDDFDVSLIAIKFSGGGHKNAAGFTANLEVLEQILDEVRI